MLSQEHCCCTAMPGHTMLAQQWTSWTLGTGRFFPILLSWFGTIGLPPVPKLENYLRDLRFRTEEDVQEEVKWWLRLQNASFYHQDFESLRRLRRKIDRIWAYIYPHITYRNLFMFQINKYGTWFPGFSYEGRCAVNLLVTSVAWRWG
jgi:hypothetical protein